MSLVILQPEGIVDQKVLKQAKTCLEAGEVISFPTETVYALASSCTDAEAIDRIYQVKERDPHKPLSILAATIEQAKEIAVFDVRAEKLAAHFFPGPLTLVLKLRDHAPIAANINAGRDTIGIRIPDHPFALTLLRYLGRPLVATSVNLSGAQSALCAEDIPEVLRVHIGLIIDGGESKLGISSTVVDLSGTEVRVLRLGSVTEQAIHQLLQN